MNSTVQWGQNTITKWLITNYFTKYGHLLKWRNEKENILDVGCAEGSVTRDIIYPYVKERVKKIVAVDKLKSLIDIANEQNNIKELDFQVMDVMDDEQVEKVNGKFDHIFSFHTAQLIPDHRSLINGFHKMLKPGGQVFVSHVVDSPMQRAMIKYTGDEKYKKYLPKGRLFIDYTDNPEEHIKNIAESVGFKIEACELEEISYPVVEFLDLYLRPIISFFAHWDYLPDQLKKDYSEDIIRYCCENSIYKGEPNVYEVTLKVLICVATKNME